MKAIVKPSDFQKLPSAYDELVHMLPPRPIHDEVDMANVIEIIDLLVGYDLNEDQEDYLDALSTFVETYENRHCPIDDSRVGALEALQFLLNEHGMTGSDLGRLLGNRTLGAAILGGKRKLSKAHIKVLAEYFKVQPGLFLK